MSTRSKFHARGRRAVVRTVVSVLVCSSFAAAGPCPDDRECVGLVLAGGGARGAAHIGVLQVMEELNVPVDFVVGTSMGSIVGGLYASGMSPDQMRRAMEQIDWAEAFDDNPPRRNIPFRRKEDDDKALFKLDLGFGKDGFKSPSGLVAGQKLNFILSSLLIHQSESKDFDDLPLPFRATAVDLNSGQLVVLDHGDLATAIRASMAYPAIFTPVEIDGMLLVDGGVLRNLPIDVALEMGADRIIAVDVGSKLSEQEGRSSALKIVRRTISVMSAEGRGLQGELIRERDLLIEPDLEGITAFESFEDMGSAIERGVAAGRAAAEGLREFSVPADEFEAFLERRRARMRKEPARIDRVEVRGAQRVSGKRITGRLETRPGQTFDLELLREDLTRVHQIGEFEVVEFHVDRRPDETVLVVEVHEKSWGPWFYRLGAEARSTLDGTGRFGANLLLRRPNLNPLGAEWKTYVTVGDTQGFFTELYQPLDYREWLFVAPRFSGAKNGDQFLYLGDDRFVIRTRRREFGFDVGATLGNISQLRLGVVSGKVAVRASTDLIDATEADTGGWRARYVLDMLDNANFPRRGTTAGVELFLSRDSLGADEEYDRLYAQLSQVWRSGKWSQLAGAAYGTDLGTTLPFHDSFALGGFLRLSGLQDDQLRGSRSAIVRLIPYRKVGNLPGLFGGDTYLGVSLELGNVWAEGEESLASFSESLVAGSLWGGVDTLFGPIYVAYGLTEGGRDTWYFYVGRIFGAETTVSDRFGRP